MSPMKRTRDEGATKRTNINLRPDQWTKLGKLSVITGATMSALIRKAIDAYLKRETKGK